MSSGDLAENKTSLTSMASKCFPDTSISRVQARRNEIHYTRNIEESLL
jgi:hypothetical protein